MKAFLTISLIFFATMVVDKSDGLTCWACYSSIQTACGEPFDSSGIAVNDYPDDERDVLCYKEKQLTDENLIIRTGAFLSEEKCDPAFLNTCKTYEDDKIVCCCNRDFCNGGGFSSHSESTLTTTKSPMVLALVSLQLILVYYY